MSEKAAPENAGPENPIAEDPGRQKAGPQKAAAGNAAPGDAGPGFPGPGEMSLYAAMLGETGRPVGWLLEGMMTAQVTSVLARLGVADELAGGPLTADQLAPRWRRRRALSRLLAAAAVYGLVSQDGQGRFALTPDGALLRSAADGSARGVAIGFLAPPLGRRRAHRRGRTQPRTGEPGRAGGRLRVLRRHRRSGLVRPGHGQVTGILVAQWPRPGSGRWPPGASWMSAAAGGPSSATCSGPCRTPRGAAGPR